MKIFSFHSTALHRRRESVIGVTGRIYNDANKLYIRSPEDLYRAKDDSNDDTTMLMKMMLENEYDAVRKCFRSNYCG